ncbi:receptor-type tyrosine-protein phosphatase F-like isoform X1 [Eriocheir sinensis]|uniref:receptor-type tyrosine-protein phosphatase F-like isoform X1 n=2 Tax=Eriocheir sinensis TaxID=95602 RepID=UPI0021C7EB3D|nr:receptor-type tyrosine-protein phosphatase F-like isoform X1 [Eriocheir sinensis]
MPSFSRGVLFLLVLLIAGLPLYCSATLDAEERQKEEQARKAATEDVSVADMAPEPPQDLLVDVQSDSVVLLTWEKPSDTADLDHYLVYVEGADMEDSTSSTFYVWEDLEACRNYTFGVRSVSAVGDMSDPELGDGRTDVGRSPQPQNLQGESESSTSMTLTWGKPDTLCDVESYRVKWGLDEADLEKTQVTNTSYTVPNLYPSTTYIFKVSAFNSAGEGDAASINETTAEDDGGPPEDLVAVGVSTSAINVSWSPPPYKLPDYYKVQGLPCMYLETNVFGLSYLITKLDPCEDCEISVTSVYDNGIEYTATTVGETLAGDIPPPKSCSVEVQDDYLTVSWVAPDSDCALGKYNVLWTSTKLWGDGEEDSRSVNTSATQYSITYPAPYSKYSFEISASIDGVFGSPASCSGTSHEALPGPPVILSVVSEQGAAVVTWETPAEENGVIKNYGITVDGGTDPVTQVAGGEHSARVEGLEPCVSVGLAVKALNGAGWGPNSKLEYVTVVDDVLPEEVDCDAQDLGVEVCWLPYSDSCPVSRYNLKWEGDVLWSDDLVDSNSTTMDWTVDEACYNISALPYTKYSVELTVGSGDEAVKCSAVTPMAAPGPPTEVNVTTEDLVITVTWSEPEKKNGIIDFYQVKWEDSAGGIGSRTTEDNSTFSSEIQEASCGVTVDVTVMAKVVDVADLGDASPPVTAFLVNSVKTLNCESSKPGQVSLSWTLEDAKCPVEFYNLTWTYDSLWSDDAGEGWENVGKDDISATVTSLPAYSNVFLQIHVDNNPEYTDCSANTPEEASSKPTSVEQIANSTSSVTVAWSLPLSVRGILNGWRLRWETMDGDLIDEDDVTDPEDMTYEVTELYSSTSYVVYVMALNGAGEGEAEKINATTAYVRPQSSPNTGLIIGLSVGGGILLILILVGGFILYRKKGSSKPPRSAPYMPEVADADSDELYKMQHLSSANQRFQNKIGSVDFGTNSELYTNPRPSLPVDELDADDDADNEIPSDNDRGPMFGAPPSRRFSQQVATSLPRLGAYNRRPSQQVNSRMRNYEEYNRRPSQQDMIGRPSLSGGPGRPPLGEYGRRPSRQIDVGRPNMKEYGRRPSQQVDLGRPNLREYGRRPSQQADLGKPRLGEYGRRPSQQADLGKPKLGEYGRRPSQQADLGRPMLAAYGRRPSQQADIGRPISGEFARRPSQQVPAVGGSFPTGLPQQGPSKRSSVDLYNRRHSQQADPARPGDRMLMKRPSQQFVMSFEGIQEL